MGRRWADVGPIYRLDPYIGPSDRVQLTRPPPGRNPGHLPAPLQQRIGVYKSSLACFVCLTAGVGPTSGQCSLAAAKMSAYRRLPTTCRRRHAAAEMPTAPRLLPTSYRLSCRDANVGPMSGQRRHATAAMPTAPRLLPTSSRFECRLAEVGPMSGRRRHATAEMTSSSQCLPTHTGIKRLCGWPKLYFSIFEFELMKLAICAELIGQLETT